MLDVPDDYEFGYRRTVVPAGTKHTSGSLALPCDIEWERDVPVGLRDGAVIHVDILRPPGGQGLPAIVAWSPYGKTIPSGLPSTVPEHWFSGYAKFEGPDAAFWVNEGYAVVNVDVRGIYRSGGGNATGFGMVDAGDGYDVIEWIAQQGWSNGRVGMHGTSWLAIAQWYIAAARPPHLKAIAPWNGMSDVYRNLVGQGGIPDLAFVSGLTSTLVGPGSVENTAGMMMAQPLINDYWKDKRARVEDIVVPAYVGADLHTGLHTSGSIDAFRRLGSKNKWLRINNSNEWYDQYTPANQKDLLRFFDRYLKGARNGWETTPPVRVTITDTGENGQERPNVPFAAWPVPDTEYRKLYLDATTGQLVSRAPSTAETVQYPATTGQAEFTIRMERDVRLVGELSARIHVSAVDAQDLDLFLLVERLERDGTVLDVPPLAKGYFPTSSPGPHGRLRASLRALDRDKSTAYLPVHAFNRSQPLGSGEVVALDIALMPIGLRVHAGQSLRLTVAGHFVGGSELPLSTINRGTHVVHTGGEHASYLTLPVVR
ncbi:CocE/NonD family hydrolase [Streptomyces sp. NPDC058867]|uniref:CocE/NonD family hydrolase n=1 Tax=unclassified Streptomyces TaxID=2593676 RepID=UPI0036B7F725